MIQILINGEMAVLKEGTSFEYIAENRMFTGSDSYSLSIAFPLRGCPQNEKIFGEIYRKDVDKETIVYDCEIREKNFTKAGSMVVTEVSEKEVKAQFLEGRSEQNFDSSFDDIYINELPLGYPAERKFSAVTPAQAMETWPSSQWVSLPWVNNTSGNLQNAMKYASGAYSWESVVGELTFQPYLLHILQQICSAVGYQGDWTEIEESPYKYLIVCNTLPWTWRAHDFAFALPHWSLTEFFEEIEKLLYGEVSINHKTKNISFHFSTKIMENAKHIHIEKVVEEYTTDVSQEEQSEYIGEKNILYAENDNRFWAYRSCQWYIDKNKKKAMVFNTLDELLVFAENLKTCGHEESVSSRGGVTGKYTRGYPEDSDGNKLFYAADVDTYFIMFCYRTELIKTSQHGDINYNWYLYYNRLEPVNQFGEIHVRDEADEEEINIVPAWIDDTDEEHGQCLFLECGDMGDSTTLEEESEGSSSTMWGGSATNRNGNTQEDAIDYNAGDPAQGKAGREIAKGEKQQAEAYFDQIYVGFWDGTVLWQGKQPLPIIDRVNTNNDFEKQLHALHLRLHEPTADIDRSKITQIDGKKKYNFSFLADEIPDPRGVYFIQGKKDVCEKITATFKVNGRSELLKGVFYKVKE